MTVQFTGLLLRIVGVLCLAWNIFLPCAFVSAQPANLYNLNQGSSNQRLIHKFDFEEARFGNFEDMPGFWHRMGEPSNLGIPHFDKQPLHQQLMTIKGYPAYTHVRFNMPQQIKGNHSLLLGLNGGNAGAFLEVGAIPAVPNSDYRITARIKTEQLEHAKVMFSVYFMDGKGRQIQASVNATKLFRSEEQWIDVSMRLHGDYPNAAWIGMQFQLIQTQYDKDALLGEHQVLFNEVDGGGEIDDIAIWQLPNIEVSTQSKVNVIRAPTRPKLKVKVRDLSGRRLVSEVTIYDYRRQKIGYKQHPVGAGSPNSWTLLPQLPGYGWYLADLVVSETQTVAGKIIKEPVARTLCSFLWLPNDMPYKIVDAKRFGISAVDLPEDQLPLLPELVTKAGLYGVTLSPWRHDTTLKNINTQQNQLDKILQPLLSSSCEVTFAMNPMPDAMLAALQQANLMAHTLFDQDENIWAPYFKPVILRHSQRVKRWVLGSANHPLAMFQKDLDSQMARTRKQFNALAPNPTLLLPWTALEPRPSHIKTEIGYVLKIPKGIRPQYIAEFLNEWNQSPQVEHTMLLDMETADVLSQQDRVTDLALRMLYGWEVTQSGMMIDKPWTVSDRRKTSLLPDPNLGVFVAMANRFSGRRVIKKLDLGRGLQCRIFDGPAGGMLAMWNESAPMSRTQLTLYMGDNPKWHDVWGNHQPMPVVDDKQQFTITREPSFIEDIDLELALLRASFHLDEPFIESRQLPHNRVVKLHNPWNETISGYLTFKEPAKWRITPKRIFFSMAANADYEIPVQLSFPISETAGDKNLVVQLQFASQKRYDVLFQTPIQVGLKDIEFHSHLTIEPNAKTGKIDTLVTQRIANRGDKVISLYSFANMTGFPRQERLISRLHPGESILRTFRFGDSAKLLKTQKIRTGLRETSGPAVLNHNLSAWDLVTQ